MPCMIDLEGIMAYFSFLRTARSPPARKRLLSAGFPTSRQIRPPGQSRGLDSRGGSEVAGTTARPALSPCDLLGALPELHPPRPIPEGGAVPCDCAHCAQEKRARGR